MKNPVFIIVCLLIALTPLMRGSVHAWAQTVIQIMVVLGLILVVVKSLKREKRSKKGRSGDRPAANESDSRNSGDSDVISGIRDGLAPDRMLWWIIGPVAVLGVWSTVMSPHPALALQGLIMLATYLGFFWLVVVSVRSRKEQRALVWVVVGTAAVLGVIGLLERYDVLTFAWWDYSREVGKNHGATRLSGVYVNANHMAGFLEMAIPMMLGMFLTRSREPEARIGMVALALFLIVCQALTLSRGGWTATAVALVFMALVLLFKKGFVHKRLVGTLLGGVVVTALIVMASTPVVERITTLTQADIELSLTGRLTYWAGTRAMIADNLAAGTGPGTFSVAFSPYQVPGLAVLPRYAHSDLLQFPAETGILAIPVMLWIVYWFFRIGFTRLKSRSRQTQGITLGAMAALVALLIHSYSDGNLQIPANALLFIAISGAGLRSFR
ncbi:O-antigen polymerase, WzyC family [Desulfotignum phosphitoxidans DSM 13687]|uniref:O-antigen polymerase, WzyC family n=1 Tax=Desulfotignum phosphitoxidans DSM 13687 TaxID=1286635 RepID=S0FRM1_9BACT|nr:O-antigen polymerase, WzyC family [Desulfotignum phosphitoxidans DSM 13687]